MRSGLLASSRALAIAIAVCVVFTTSAGAATQRGDSTIARAGVLVVDDFPAGFEASDGAQQTHSDNIKLAKGVAGCGPYVTLQKTVAPLPQAKSARFADASRSVGNEVDVFGSERAAGAALTLYAKSSIVGCLENLFEKQARQDPDVADTLDDVVVSLDRQDIAGLGDDSVVYEGSVVLTGTDGSTQQVGVGSAAVRVGRAVDVVSYSTDYSTEQSDLTEILTPAIDASVARLRAALAK
jgi:hypothetical protein